MKFRFRCKPDKYKGLRIEIAKMYAEEDNTLFGYVSPSIQPENIEELNKEDKENEKELINKGYNQVVKKKKKYGNFFQKQWRLVVKIVLEFYVKLIKTWSGQANTELFPLE